MSFFQRSSLSFFHRGRQPQYKKLWNEYLAIRIKKSKTSINDNVLSVNNLTSNSNDISVTDSNDSSDKGKDDESINSFHEFEEMIQEYELLSNFLDIIIIENETVKDDIKSIHNNDNIDHQAIWLLCNKVQLVQSEELMDIIESIFCYLLDFAVSYSSIPGSKTDDTNIDSTTIEDKKRRSNDKENEAFNISYLILRSLVVVYSIFSENSYRGKLLMSIENEKDTLIISNILKVVTTLKEPINSIFILNIIARMSIFPITLLPLIRGNIVNRLLLVFESIQDKKVRLLIIDLIKTILNQYRNNNSNPLEDIKQNENNENNETNIITYKGFERTYKFAGHLLNHGRPNKQSPKIRDNVNKTFAERGFSIAFNMMNELLRMTHWMAADSDKDILDGDTIYNFTDIEMRAIPFDILTTEHSDVNKALKIDFQSFDSNDLNYLSSINSLLVFRLECIIDLESFIDSLSTISDMLFANKALQIEFENCLGYKKVIDTVFFLDESNKIETGNYSIISRNLLSIITNASWTNNVDNESVISQSTISNIYSVVMLKILMNSDKYHFVLMAVEMVQDLIRGNPMNVVALEEMGILNCLSEKLISFIHDLDADNFQIELIVAIVMTLQMVSVATSYRDNDVVALFTQILLYISYSNEYQSFGEKPVEPQQRCSNCEMELAVFECIHEKCIREGRIGLCFECDKVFHKSSAKRSHIRLPIVNDHVEPCLATLNSKGSNHICYISALSSSGKCRSNDDVTRESLLLVFVYALRGLIDDQASRNQELLPILLESILLVLRKVVAQPISVQNDDPLKIIKLIQKVDLLNNLSNDEIDLEQLSQYSIRRLIVCSLIKLLSRTLLPSLHIPYFLEEVDPSKKNVKNFDMLYIFRSYGGEALLSHLLLDNSSIVSEASISQFSLSESDKQLVIWILREVLVTAVEISNNHTKGIIQWLVWLLSCPSTKSISSNKVIPKMGSNFNPEKSPDLNPQNFAIVPISYSALSGTTKLHLVQELQLLFAGEDNDNFTNGLCDNFSSIKSKNMSIIPLNHVLKTSRHQSFELFTKDDISKTNSKDMDPSFPTSSKSIIRKESNKNVTSSEQLPLLYRTPTICSCMQDFFNNSNCIQTLVHLTFGDLCDNHILAELFNEIIKSDHLELELLEVEVELWWQSFSLLIRLLCNNDKGKSIIDNYVNVAHLIKALLPLTQNTLGPSSNSSFFLKNEMSGAILNFLVELCVSKSRIFPPTKPFIALSTQSFDSAADTNKFIRSKLNLMSRPTLSSFRIYTDLAEKLDESGCSPNSFLNLSPIYYAEDRFLKFVNEIIRPKPLLILPKIQKGFTSMDSKGSNVINGISSIPGSIQVARKLPLVPVDSKETLGETAEVSTVGSYGNLKYHKSYNSILTLNSTSSLQLGNDTDSVNAWENESQGRNSHHSLLALGQILLPNSPNTPPGGSILDDSTLRENQKTSFQVQDNENVSMTSEPGVKYSSMNSSTAYFPLFDILDSYNETSADTLLTIISEAMSARAGYIYKTDKRLNLLTTNGKSISKQSDNSKDSSSHSSNSIDGPSIDFMQIALKRQLFALLPTSKERKILANWQPNFSRIAIRSNEHAQLLIAIALVTSDDSQTLAFGIFLHLLEGNPHNSDLLFSSSRRALLLVEMLPHLNEKARDSMTYLIAQIFSYHADNDLLTSLMRGAYTSKSDELSKMEALGSSSKRKEEKKKHPDISRQLLQIVKQAAVKKSPYRYIHFDSSHPFKSRIMLPALDRLPNPKLGITITSWLRIGCIGQCPTSSLYQIAINNGHSNVVNVIDVYYRIVYKTSSKDCETTSNASGWSAFPNDLYISDDSTKRSLQLCLSFSAQRNSKLAEAVDSPYRNIAEMWEAIITKLNVNSKYDDQMNTLATAIMGNSLPDAIIDYEWNEVGEWQLLSLSLCETGLTCYINGVERSVLYWTPLGYRCMADTNGNYKNLYNPLDSKDLGMDMCVGGRFVEEKAYSEIMAHISEDSSKENKLGSFEEDILNIYSKLIGGFSGTLSDFIAFEGALECSQQQHYFSLGPNSDISTFSNRRLINISPVFGKKESEQVFSEESGPSSQDRIMSPQAAINLQNKTKSKRPEPFPLAFGNNNPTNSSQTSRVSDLFSLFGGTSSALQKGNADEKNSSPEFYGTLEVYKRSSLQESIDKSGGLKILYPLLVADRMRQVEAMRIIAALLQSSQIMFRKFFSSGQQYVLLYCLHNSPSITSAESLKEFFDLLCLARPFGFKFASDIMHKNQIKLFNRPQVLNLLFDIIIASPKKPQIARSQIDWLREICDNTSENCGYVLELSLLLPILILLSLWSVRSLDPTLAVDNQSSQNKQPIHDYIGPTERSRLQISCSKLLRILLMGTSGIYHKTVSSAVNIVTPTGFSVENLSLLIYFVQYSLRSALTEVDNFRVTPYLKHDTDLHMPFFGTNDHQNWSLNAALATIDGILAVSDGPLFATISNMLRSTFPKDVWFHFLDLASSIHVSIRERALRLICMCMSLPNGEIDTKQLLIFEKLYGFEVLGEHLAFYTADENVVESLIAMMFWKLGPRPYGVGEANDSDIEKVSSNETVAKNRGDSSEKRVQEVFQGDFLSSRSEDMDISSEYVIPLDSEVGKPSNDKSFPAEETNSTGLLSFFNWKNTKSLLTSENTVNLDQIDKETINLDNTKLEDNGSNGLLSREISFASLAMESPDNAELAFKNRRHSATTVSSGTRRLLSPLSAALLGLNEDEINSMRSPARRKRNIPNVFRLDENMNHTESEQRINLNPSFSMQTQETLILPQAIYCLMKVLQTSQRSDIVARSCGCLERALIISINGEAKVNMRNLEALTSQKDWLILMYNCIQFFRKKIRSNANFLNDQFSDSESIGDYRSESGMESEDSREKSRSTNDNNGRSNAEEHFTSPILDLIKTIMILAMEQKPNIAQKYLSEVFRLPVPDANEVQVDVIFDILDAIDSCALRPTEDTFNLLKNFNSFLEQIIEKIDMGIDICARVLQTIQGIGYRAPPDIRSRIKEIGLQETRNTFVCSCLIEYSGLMDRDKENYDRVALWIEVQPSLYAYLSASESKQLTDNQVIFIILGIFMECTEDFDSISHINLEDSPDIDVSVLLERLQIILTVLEALIAIIQGCASISVECSKCLVRIFGDLVGDVDNNILRALAYNFTPLANDPSTSSITPSISLQSSNKAHESSKEGDESKSWWSWNNHHQTTLSNETSLNINRNFNKCSDKVLEIPFDARSFLDWYCSPDRKELYREIKKRMARDLVPILKQNEKILEKNVQRRTKYIKSLQDKHQKDKVMVTKGMNESSNKAKVIGNTGYKECTESMKTWMNELNKRIEKGKNGYEEQVALPDKTETKIGIEPIEPDLLHYLQHNENMKFSEEEMRKAMVSTMEFIKQTKLDDTNINNTKVN